MSNSWLNSYRIEGMLGRETLEHEIKSRVTIKCDYGIVFFEDITLKQSRPCYKTPNVEITSENTVSIPSNVF